MRIEIIDRGARRRLSPKLTADAMAAAVEVELRKGAFMIEGRAKRSAPVDTGRLRASITTQPDSQGREIGYKVGTDVEYAPLVEFGTGRRGAASALTITAQQAMRDEGYEHGARAGMSAQPFLFPAYEQSRDAIIGALRRAVERVLK